MNDELKEAPDGFSRRDFLRLGSLTAVGLSVPQLQAEAPTSTAASMIGVPFTAVNPKIGIIGTGGRGTSLLKNLLAADAQILALCDVVPGHAENAQSLVVKSGRQSP